ncbi:MAG: hypothetical protein AAF270_15990 [Pseudomonadota bacterium]
MFKRIRILALLLVLLFVALSAWLSQARSTDWNNTLWIRVYPINADNDPATQRYIESLSVKTFVDIEAFFAREVARHGVSLDRPVRMELGPQLPEEPPRLTAQPSIVDTMLWSLKTRWWVSSITRGREDIPPDVRIFMRFHHPDTHLVLDDSVGLRKGMFGIVNAYADRRFAGRNNFILAHEFLHTIGASDKYSLNTNQPIVPIGLAEPDRRPLFPQRYAEIMGGRIALSSTDAVTPKNLTRAIIGRETALEIRLVESLP